MNPELVQALIRQRLKSPLRMTLLAVSAVFPLLIVAFVPGAGLAPLDGGLNMALIFGAGMIGQDVSSGVLQLLFARPVRRSEYVVSRWVGAAGAASLIALAQVALGYVILASRPDGPSAVAALAHAGETMLVAIGATAVLAFFSALVPGLGDLGLYVVGNLAGGTLGVIGQAANQVAFRRAGDEVLKFLTPRIDIGTLTAGPVSWFEIVSYLSTVTLCLALAIVVLNRKELSYASG